LRCSDASGVARDPHLSDSADLKKLNRGVLHLEIGQMHPTNINIDALLSKGDDLYRKPDFESAGRRWSEILHASKSGNDDDEPVPSLRATKAPIAGLGLAGVLAYTTAC